MQASAGAWHSNSKFMEWRADYTGPRVGVKGEFRRASGTSVLKLYLSGHGRGDLMLALPSRSTGALARRWCPSDDWVRFLLVPCLAFIALASNTAYLADFWHHLARGRAIVEDGRLLDHDIFTCTVPGQSFQDLNWLSQVIYYQLFDVGGLALVR